MNTITDKLADALRALLSSTPCACSFQGCGTSSCAGSRHEDAETVARDALAAYDAFMLGVAEAHSDVTTHVGPDLIETYDEGRASVRGIED